MTDQTEPQSKKPSFILIATLLLMGHTTTAPWNSFINNEEYFKWKLEGSQPFERQQQSEEYNAKPKEILNCCVAQLDSQRDFKNFQFCHKSNQSIPSISNKVPWDVKDYEKAIECVEFNPPSTDDKANTTEKPSTTTDYATFWGSALSTVALTMTFLSAVLGTAIIKYTSTNLRVFGTLILCTFVFLATILFGWMVEDVTMFFILTMVTVVLVIFASGIAQTSFFSEVGPMTPQYVIYMMEGQGLGGVYIALFIIIANYGFKEHGIYKSEDAMKSFMSLFFLQAILTTIACLILFKRVFQQCSEYLENKQKSESASPSDSERKDLLNTDNKPDASITNRTIPTVTIIKYIWIQMLSIFTTFFICLSLFPACLTNIRQGPRDAFGIKTVSWTFIHYAVFLTFNIGDWLGKKAGKYRFDYKKEGLLLSLTFVRLVYYYLFYLCNPAGTRSINDGWIFITIMATFALTNGYFGSMVMAQAGEAFAWKAEALYNEQEIKQAQRQVTPFMIISLVAGLLAGACCSNISARFWAQVFVRDVQFGVQQSMIDGILTAGL